MDSVLILFQRKLPKVIIDPTKSFLEPNWKESLKVNFVPQHLSVKPSNGKINIYMIILF